MEFSKTTELTKGFRVSEKSQEKLICRDRESLRETKTELEVMGEQIDGNTGRLSPLCVPIGILSVRERNWVK